jgi:NAD-dependent deacetylase
MKKIVVLTGAGISAESGIRTFRDSNGLWEEYRIEDVATFEAWQRNPELVQEFYNQRRKQLYEVKPNAAHYALTKLEKKYIVNIITQNVDDLHERAGSANVIHLHGELKKAQSTIDPDLVYPIDGWELRMGDKCEKGSQLRPHIVWFGEEVPMIVPAARLTALADIFIVIGTSLNVYPAAGLIHNAPKHCSKYLVDPKDCKVGNIQNLTFIKENAVPGLSSLVEKLLQSA